MSAFWSPFDAPASVASEPTEAARAAARLSATADGITLLSHLAALVGPALEPSATDAALRYREGQRALVAHIATLIERGKAHE